MKRTKFSDGEKCQGCKHIFQTKEIYSYWVEMKKGIPDNNPHLRRLCRRCARKEVARYHNNPNLKLNSV